MIASLALSCAEITAKAWRLLVDRFGSAAGALAVPAAELEASRGLSQQARARVLSARERLDEMETVLQRLEDLNARVLLLSDSAYPALLKQIPDPPCVLYVRGDLRPEDKFAIAIVGSRNPRPYGAQMARTISSDLARAGLTVVSGGARGVDSAAHDAAMRAGGRTIAVLGCGVDISYPSENRELFDKIAGQGAVVSEYCPGAPPESWRFPRRNRIISGLSRGVVVCDAPEDSGSLITATCATEQGRDVFAVPGNVDSGHNRGAHRLLKEGARLAESAADVLEELGLEQPEDKGPVRKAQPAQVTPDEMRILEMLDLEPMPLDTIIEQMGLPASDVAGLLTFLEMKHLVKRVAGPAYVRVLG